MTTLPIEERHRRLRALLEKRAGLPIPPREALRIAGWPPNAAKQPNAPLAGIHWTDLAQDDHGHIFLVRW